MTKIKKVIVILLIIILVVLAYDYVIRKNTHAFTGINLTDQSSFSQDIGKVMTTSITIRNDSWLPIYIANVEFAGLVGLSEKEKVYSHDEYGFMIHDDIEQARSSYKEKNYNKSGYFLLANNKSINFFNSYEITHTKVKLPDTAVIKYKLLFITRRIHIEIH